RLVPMFDIGLGFDHEATGFGNIQARGLMLGLSRREIQQSTEERAVFSELGEYLAMPLRTYSAGMTLRLMFSIATCVEGDIILMDEWLSAGDENFRVKAQQRMLAAASRAGLI